MKLFVINMLFLLGIVLLFAIIDFDFQRLNIGFIVYIVVWITTIILTDAKKRNF